jgi:hypothetical protein
MNQQEPVKCQCCGSLDMRWVTSLLAVWDGAVLRCAACRQLRMVATVARRS